MSSTLNDLWGNTSDQFFVWCDIDGHGDRWMLAIPLDDEQIFFPHDQFEDYVDHYLKYPARRIPLPMHPE
jgi:hypothetical protein